MTTLNPAIAPDLQPLLKELQRQLTRAECEWHKELEKREPDQLRAEYFHGVSRGIKAAIEAIALLESLEVREK